MCIRPKSFWKRKMIFPPKMPISELANPSWGAVLSEHLPSVVKAWFSLHPAVLAPFPCLPRILTSPRRTWLRRWGCLTRYVFWFVTLQAFSFAAHGLLFQCLLLALVISVVGQCSLSLPDGEFLIWSKTVLNLHSIISINLELITFIFKSWSLSRMWRKQDSWVFLVFS